MKKILIMMLILSIGLVSGCSKAADTDAANTISETAATGQKNIKKVTVFVPKSPSAIPILRMIDTKALGENYEIDLQLYTDMETLMASATKKNYGFMAIPADTAITLFNKGFEIKLLNMLQWGGMYLSTTDPDCKGWEDLKGKRLFVPSKGSVIDIITQHYLNKHGLKIGDDVEVVYSHPMDIAQLIVSGKATYAIDVEPNVSFNIENVNNYRIVSEFAEEWKKIEGSEFDMPIFGVIVNNKFLDDNQKIVKKFNEELKKATEWMLNNPHEAGLIAEKYINRDSKLVEKAVPGGRFMYKTALDARVDFEKYCNVVLSSLKPEIIGGGIPDENFYYENK